MGTCKSFSEPNSLTTSICLFSLILFGLLFPSEVKAQDQRYVFFYQLEYAIDSTNPGQKKNDLMVLWSTPDQSLFQSYYGYQKDSVAEVYFNFAKERDRLGQTSGRSSFLEQMLQDMGRFPVPGFSYKIVKSKDEGLIQNYRKIFKTNYVYTEPLDQMKWKIEKGSKEIMGFKSQMATTEYGGRKIIAWFSTEIPINDGPYTFSGLPGLIVELYDSECHYHFKLASIKKHETNLSELIPTGVINVDKAKYFKLEDEYKENAFSQMSEADASRVSASSAAERKERFKSHNNRLELIIK